MNLSCIQFLHYIVALNFNSPTLESPSTINSPLVAMNVLLSTRAFKVLPFTFTSRYSCGDCGKHTASFVVVGLDCAPYLFMFFYHMDIRLFSLKA